MNSTPGNPRLDHAVDRVDTAAADTDDSNHRLVRLAAPRRLVGRLLAPVARRFHDRLKLTPPRAAAPRRRHASTAPAASRTMALRQRSCGPAPGRQARDGRLRLGSASSGRGPPAEDACRRPSGGSAGSPAAVPGPASGGSSGASSAVDRKRSARGPSRMLARLSRRAHVPEPPSPDLGSSSRRCSAESYLSTLAPLTGASANLIALRIRDLKTRSPKFSSRISTASLA